MNVSWMAEAENQEWDFSHRTTNWVWYCTTFDWVFFVLAKGLYFKIARAILKGQPQMAVTMEDSVRTIRTATKNGLPQECAPPELRVHHSQVIFSLSIIQFLPFFQLFLQGRCKVWTQITPFSASTYILNQPWYSQTWIVAKVLDHARTLEPSETPCVAIHLLAIIHRNNENQGEEYNELTMVSSLDPIIISLFTGWSRRPESSPSSEMAPSEHEDKQTRVATRKKLNIVMFK